MSDFSYFMTGTNVAVFECKPRLREVRERHLYTREESASISCTIFIRSLHLYEAGILSREDREKKICYRDTLRPIEKKKEKRVICVAHMFECVRIYLIRLMLSISRNSSRLRKLHKLSLQTLSIYMAHARISRFFVQ